MNGTRREKVPVPLQQSLYFLHPYSASLVTCKGKNGKINVMTVAWIIPVSVNPPLLAMSIRPERYSHDLIIESKEFAVNIPTFKLAQKVLFCGRRSGKDHEKFKETSLTPEKAIKVNVPIIKECVAHLECKLVKSMKMGDHTLIIGQIVVAYALAGYFEEVYNLAKFRPCLHLGKDYFTTCMRRKTELKLPHN
jgi:flavin reductase (DIM6/NTAB) family NADH-FMN oxidoreductase RutF